MKKLILLTAILFSINSVLAQQNDTWVLSGEIGIRNDNTISLEGRESNDTNLTINLLSRVGYVFTDSNIEVGLGLGYSRSELENFFANDRDKLISTTVFPYVKKYFPVTEKFAFHLTGEIGYKKSYIESLSNNNDFDIRETGIIFRPGFVYFLSKKFAINANFGTLGYLSTTAKIRGLEDTKTESFVFSIAGSNIFIGVAYYL